MIRKYFINTNMYQFLYFDSWEIKKNVKLEYIAYHFALLIPVNSALFLLGAFVKYSAEITLDK